MQRHPRGFPKPGTYFARHGVFDVSDGARSCLVLSVYLILIPFLYYC